jgi:hypothetical protein
LLVIQVSQYFFDDDGIFDAGNDAYITPTFATGFYVMLKTRFNRFAQVIEARFPAGVWPDSSGDWVLLHLPRLAGVTRARYLLFGAPKVGALGEHTMKPGQVDPGFGDQ